MNTPHSSLLVASHPELFERFHEFFRGLKMTEPLQQPLKAKLLAMMVLRVVVALVFLGITTWLQIKEYPFARPNLYPLYTIVVIIGLLTIFYARVISRVKNLKFFTYAQVTADIMLVTGIVYVTGGIESYLSVLYFLSVIGGSILINKRGGFYAASIASIAYGALIDLEYYGMLSARHKIFLTTPVVAPENVLRTIATNILAYFIVAYLTGYLAERTAKAERELEEKGVDLDKLERLNRHIVENITSGIVTIDSNLRVTSFNRAAEAITGYALRDVYYKDVNEVFPGLIDRASFDEIGLAGSGVRIEQVFKKKEAAELYLGFTVSRGSAIGEARSDDMAGIVIFQDLTQLKAMEEQLRRGERLKALGELSVGIAHEVRNPLASISGSIQVLKGDLDLKGEDERLMDIIVRETERLNTLITDFLLFARPAQERRERIDIAGVVNETVEIFKNSPEAASIGLKCDIGHDIYVDGDERQMGQVFWNLFLNAAHSMEKGGTITVRSYYRRGKARAGLTEEAAEPGQLAAITVEDTGCGIEPEHLERIFDPFFSTKDSGTGLGLAIAHRIVESHGGSLEVRSTVGIGTVFTVLLPRASMA